MRLTSLGAGVLAIGVAGLVLGIAGGFPAVTAVGAFLVLLVAISALTVNEAPAVNVARSAFPTEVDRGDPAEIRLRFRSTSPRRAGELSIVETVDGVARVATVGPIPPLGSEQVRYLVETSRRGQLVAGPVTVRRFDPFGLVTADRRFTATCTVNVRPRRYPLRWLPSGRRRDLEGPTRERSEGTATFHQLRPYVPGDDLRRVHWRSTARTGQLLVKQMVDTTRPELVVVVDNRSSAIDAVDFEHAVDAAASIVHAATVEDYPTILFFADSTAQAAADDDRVPLIDRLTAVQLGDADTLADLAEVIVSRGRSLVVVTGEPSGDDLTTLAKLARGFSPALLVSIARERRGPAVAPRGMETMACADGAEFAELWGTVGR